jgi:enoyl-CoA hydratase/carnithine racemase
MTAFDTGTDTLLVDVAKRIALVTFNRPTQHNAMSASMREAVPPTLQARHHDPNVRVVVLTGALDSSGARSWEVQCQQHE